MSLAYAPEPPSAEAAWQRMAGQLGGMSVAEAALAYATSGLAVLPLHHPIPRPGGEAGCSCGDVACGAIGKHPRTLHGLHDASTNPRQVAAWWRRWPQANIGLVTGGRFDVLDVDGTAGVQALRRLGAGRLWLPGPVVRTGGGWHYYLAPTGRGNAQPIRGLERVDWRGRGGYVLAPPSRHAIGARYRWLRPLTDVLPEAPAPLRECLAPAPAVPVSPPRPPSPVTNHRGYAERALADECHGVATAPRGGRNARLWRAARNLFNFVAGGALDEHEVEAALLTAAATCGLLADEPRQTHRTIRSGRRVGLAHPRGNPNQRRSQAANG